MQTPNTGQSPNRAPSTPAPVVTGGGGRRSLFAGAVALACAPLAAKATPSNPDAELIGACAAFCFLERLYGATLVDAPGWNPEGEEAEAERMRLLTFQVPYMDTIGKTTATTAAGLRAIVSAISMSVSNPGRDDPEGYENDRLYAALIRAARRGVA